MHAFREIDTREHVGRNLDFVVQEVDFLKTRSWLLYGFSDLEVPKHGEDER